MNEQVQAGLQQLLVFCQCPCFKRKARIGGEAPQKTDKQKELEIGVIQDGGPDHRAEKTGQKAAEDIHEEGAERECRAQIMKTETLQSVSEKGPQCAAARHNQPFLHGGIVIEPILPCKREVSVKKAKNHV